MIDTPVMIIFGLLFAPYLRNDENERAPCLSPAFILGLILTTLFVVSVIWSYRIAPDWMWMYFPESTKISLLGWAYILIMLYYFPYIGGFLFGKEVFRRSRAGYWLSLLFFLIMEGVVIGLLFQRYIMVGTRADFYAGKAVSLNSPSNPVAPVLNGTSIVLVIVYLIMWYYLRKHKKEEEIS